LVTVTAETAMRWSFPAEQKKKKKKSCNEQNIVRGGLNVTFYFSCEGGKGGAEASRVAKVIVDGSHPSMPSFTSPLFFF
jgi:hypothetical protein